MNSKWYSVLVMFCMAGFLILAPSANAQTYVGPEKCLTCHGAIKLDASGWRTSMHGNGYSVVLDDAHSMENLLGIVNDADQNGVDDFKDGLDFNAISSAFDPYKPNAPVLGYSAATGYTITIGARTHKVYLTYGGSGLYKQRYVVKIATDEGESNDYYVSPIQFNEKTSEYVLYHPDAWYDASDAPIDYSTRALASTNSRSLAKGCSGCHMTGLELQQDANGEWLMSGAGVEDESLYADKNNVFDIDGDGDLDQINTGCERCHGPGGDHVALPVATNIINPETDLTTDQANNMCGMCHSRGKSLPNNTFSFPFDDQNMQSWAPGDLVANLYTDGGGYWPDGVNSKKHHQQFPDFSKSGKPDFQFHPVTCYECHDVHNAEKHHMRTELVETDSTGGDLTIATQNDDNTLCLACHATHGDFTDIPKEWVADYANHETEIGAIVSKHSNHDYDPTGTGSSRCSKCHNPKVAKSAVAYDVHSHTFEAISPQKTLDFNMPNSCAVSCHNKDGFPNFGVDVAADNFTDWSEATDATMSNELLYWYDNMWFKQMGGEGKTVQAPEVSNITIDGDLSDWDGIDWVNDIPLANNRMVSMKSAVTTTDINFLFKWADPTMSMTRSGSWSYDGTNWTTSSGQSEDRLAVMWNINIPDAEWQERGCMNKCHRNSDNLNVGNDPSTEDDAYLPAGQKADMWHMKAARSLGAISASQEGALTVDALSHEVTAGKVTLIGYMDDKYIGEFDASNAPDGGRYGDAGANTYARNRNAAKTGPEYIETAPADYMDAMILRQSEIDNGEAVLVANATPTDLAGYWAVYDGLGAVVPERILHAPAGSRGDVMQAAVWDNGFWYTEVKRALKTGNDDDAEFTVGNFTFALALMDNTGGEGHWTQGSVLNTLEIPTITGVDSRQTASVPETFSLRQNYPNPFNPTTNIEFDVVRQGRVSLKVYNVLGEMVRALVDDILPAGRQRVTFNASGLASGVYYYRLEAKDFVATRKLLLLR